MKLSVFTSCLFIPLYLVLGEEIGVLVYHDAQSGVYLAHSAFLMLFMGISGLSTSVLNSMGLEKKTLLYYIVSALVMLACIWFLPKFIGVYSLIAGFTVVYGATSVMNLRLINKKSRVKPNYLKFVLLGIAFLIPSAAVGFLLENLLIDYLGNLLTLIVIGGVMTVFNVLLYAVFGLIDLSVLKKLPILRKFKKREKRKASPRGADHLMSTFNGLTALSAGIIPKSSA